MRIKTYEEIESLGDEVLRAFTGTKHTNRDKLVAIAKGKWRLENEEDTGTPAEKLPEPQNDVVVVEKKSSLSDLIMSDPDAKAELQEMLDLAASRAQPAREADLPEMFERKSDGKIIVRNKFRKDLLQGVEAFVPERISDFFIDMRTKEVYPYSYERALYSDAWAMFPCAANGGIYHYKVASWSEAKLVKANRRKVRQPQLLIRQILDNRHPTLNHKGIIICDRNGSSVEFFAKELSLGLNWSAPKWEAMPYKFMS